MAEAKEEFGSTSPEKVQSFVDGMSDDDVRRLVYERAFHGDVVYHLFEKEEIIAMLDVVPMEDLRKRIVAACLEAGEQMAQFRNGSHSAHEIARADGGPFELGAGFPG